MFETIKPISVSEISKILKGYSTVAIIHKGEKFTIIIPSHTILVGKYATFGVMDDSGNNDRTANG